MKSKSKTDAAPSVRRPLPAKFVRKDVDDLSSITTHSELDLHIVRLLALHPALKVRFRNHDLSALDVAAKEALLDDMNVVLGIRKLGKRGS